MRWMELIQEDIKNLNSLLSIKVTESVNKNVSTRNITVTLVFKGEFSQILTGNLQGKTKKEAFSNTFNETNINLFFNFIYFF